jgi:8-oxo-dGTP pyrophosphatase MutT (NUDIX family)
MRPLTPLLGELLRSSLPGIKVALTSHEIARAEHNAPTAVVVITIAADIAEAVCWVTDHTIEVRVLVRSREHDGVIAEMVGGSIDYDNTDFGSDELSNLLDEILEEIGAQLGDELEAAFDEMPPALATDWRWARRMWDNRPLPI